MTFQYRFTNASFKSFQKLPNRVQQRLVSKLDFCCTQTNPLAYASKLSDHSSGTYRFRIGTYRVIFDIVDSNTLLILDVGHRRYIYS